MLPEKHSKWPQRTGEQKRVAAQMDMAATQLGDVGLMRVHVSTRLATFPQRYSKQQPTLRQQPRTAKYTKPQDTSKEQWRPGRGWTTVLRADTDADLNTR